MADDGEKKIKVLIAEDEYPIMKGVSAKFGLAGFEVLTAADGQQALTIALAEHPDLILLDYRMPVLDGFAMLTRLRTDPWGKTARVVMWTNSYGAESKSKARELGAMDYIVKSDVEYRDVIVRVRELVARPS